jgi:hypothetical protein
MNGCSYGLYLMVHGSVVHLKSGVNSQLVQQKICPWESQEMHQRIWCASWLKISELPHVP